MTKAELEASRDSSAREYVRESNECELMDDYVAHEGTYCAGFDFAAALLQGEMDALSERRELLERALLRVLDQPFKGNWDAQAVYIQHMLHEEKHWKNADGNKSLTTQLQSANAKLAKVREALEFYANKENWNESYSDPFWDSDKEPHTTNLFFTSEDEERVEKYISCGGKLAREALAIWKDEAVE